MTKILITYISLYDIHTLLPSLHEDQIYAADEYYDSCKESPRSEQRCSASCAYSIAGETERPKYKNMDLGKPRFYTETKVTRKVVRLVLESPKSIRARAYSNKQSLRSLQV